jgi:hypothetical protein
LLPLLVEQLDPIKLVLPLAAEAPIEDALLEDLRLLGPMLIQLEGALCFQDDIWEESKLLESAMTVKIAM